MLGPTMLSRQAVGAFAVLLCAALAVRGAPGASPTEPDPALAFAVEAAGKTFVNKVCAAVVYRGNS